ncbi:MAG: 30S ribosomal protein S20 [Syntrophomonadaceae bacterium]|nr:30S ribosomal protein S20 [Syntrophomonadaceae bacterium]
MPNIKSAIKRVEVSRKRTAKNVAARSSIKTAIKRFDQAITEDSVENTQITFKRAISLLDRAARKGLLHPNAVARRKSKLTRKLNATRVNEKAE